MDRFARQINAVQRRTETLNQSLAEPSSLQPGLLVQAFNQLQDALEELRVTHNELRNQKEQLADSYRSAELERQRYRNLFDFAPDAYLITDRDGNIAHANRAAANLFQLPIQSLNNWANKSLIDFLPEHQYHAFQYQLQRLPPEETLKDWEVVFYKQNGQTFPATISVNVVKNLNNEINFHWLIRDISARKQAEEVQAIKSENLQLQETARLKSQFMAMMSHELRTPMHIILGFAQLLLRQPYQLLAPQLKNMVERIYNNAKHLLTLIEDILDFTALESGKLNLNSQQFNLAELIQTVTQELQHLADRKQLPLVVDIQLQNPTIIGDKQRIRQILINLLDNAIKFTDKGSVTLEVSELPEERIAIVVRDTGIGIATDDIKCIFQEFRQVNQTYCRTHGGTGLGLSIVDKLVKLMNGTISVESQLGSGSTFKVEIPREVESAE